MMTKFFLEKRICILGGRSEKGCGNDIFGLKMGLGFGESGGTPPPRVTPHWEISLLSVRE